MGRTTEVCHCLPSCQCHSRFAHLALGGMAPRGMKFTLVLLIVASLMCARLFAADTVKASPRFKARVVCFNGKLDSGSSCASTCFQPDGALDAKGKMTCGFPGQISEVEWSFVERRGDRDVYRFTRRFRSDTPAATTTSKTIEFKDRRVLVFQDKFQALVIEPPTK